MKKIVIGIFILTMIIGLVACTSQEEEIPYASNHTINSIEDTGPREITDEELFDEVLREYREAYKQYDLEDIEKEEKLMKQYRLVNFNLLMHVARYAEEGVKLTYGFYDIDWNGFNELVVGANNSLAAIYAYDFSTSKVKKIFLQDTIERGSLEIYANGTILSSGSGGAALHYFEFGNLSESGTSYQLLEAIEEEYLEEDQPPVYRDSKTQEKLAYKSLDEITEKYLWGDPVSISMKEF